jgi:hypothetical protein
MVEAARSDGYPVVAPNSRVLSASKSAQMRSAPDGGNGMRPRSFRERRYKMEVLDTYTSALAVLSAALLLVAAGLAKKQLVWKRAKPVRARRRRWRI